MHPILSQPRKLALYLLAWIPIAGMLTYLLGIPGESLVARVGGACDSTVRHLRFHLPDRVVSLPRNSAG